jgi:hypothetical protein
MKSLSCLAALGLLVLTFGTARANPVTIAIGPRLSLNTDGNDAALGAEARFGVLQLAPKLRLDIRPSFDWIFVGHGLTFWALSGDALFALDVGTPTVEPYGIVGIGIFHSSYDIPFGGGGSDTNVGLNLGGGARFLMTGKIQPFVEIRASIHNGSYVLLTGGVLIVI